MRYTASQFKNEADVAEIRFGTIGDIVDRIVIAEATVDQRGRPKPLTFEAATATGRFDPWLDKIEYVIVDDMPEGNTHLDDFARERHQRNALIRGMPDLQPDDLVYVSDLDEIPYPHVLDWAFEQRRAVRFGMDLFPYSLSFRWLDRGCRIATLGAVIHGRDILESGVCWAVLEDSRVEQLPGVNGWHLHNQGGVEVIRDKVEGMMDKWQHLIPLEWGGVPPEGFMSDEWIQDCIDHGKDLFGREYRPSEWVPTSALPGYVQRNLDRFVHMLVPRPENQDEIEAQPRCTCGAIYVEGVLNHFPYCRLAEEPGTFVFRQDSRSRPRAEDV